MVASHVPCKRVKNPYTHRSAIKDPDQFADRNREIKESLDHITKNESVSIVGPRRIGKTSLLLCLPHKARELEADTGKKHLYVFLDCQRIPNASQSTVYQWIWSETRKCVESARSLLTVDGATEEVEGKAKKLPAEVESIEELESAFGWLRDAGYELTLLLDEFELMAANAALDINFFTHLRRLTNSYPVSYVTSSTKSLLNLNYANRDVLGSPFFTIFHQQHLGLFITRDNAKELIRKPLQKIELPGRSKDEVDSLPGFSEDEINFLIDLAGSHPALLQVACYYLFEHKVPGEETSEPAKNEVRQQFKEAVNDYFRYAWGQLTEDERAAMWLICKDQGERVSSAMWTAVERQCLVYEREPFSLAFKEFVLQTGIEEANGVRPRTRILDVLIGVLILLMILFLTFSAWLEIPVLLYISAGFLFIIVVLFLSK